MLENVPVISFLSQKGGVGKSTLAALFATWFANEKVPVCLVDFDIQETALLWGETRREAECLPKVEVISCRDLENEEKKIKGGKFVIADCPGDVSEDTFQVAKMSKIIVLPVSPSGATLPPQLKLAQELIGRGIEAEKIAFLFNHVSSKILLERAREAIRGNMENECYIFKSFLPNKTAYVGVYADGKALNETPYGTLNEKANIVVEELNDRINSLYVPR